MEPCFAFDRVDVLRGEFRAALQIQVIERQHQQFAERVRIDVTRRLQEVRDVAPPHAVIVAQVDAVAEHRLLCLHPQLGDALDGKLGPEAVGKVLSGDAFKGVPSGAVTVVAGRRWS